MAGFFCKSWFVLYVIRVDRQTKGSNGTTVQHSRPIKEIYFAFILTTI